MPKKKAINQNQTPRKRRRRVREWLQGVIFYYESKNFGIVFGIVIAPEQEKGYCSEEKQKESGSMSFSLNRVTIPPHCIIFVQSKKPNRPPVLAITEGAPLETAYQVPKSMRHSPAYENFKRHMRSVRLLMNKFDITSKTK